MDFLTKLYSNDNFGIILFTSISILVLAFLIILFFGKKDQKERKLAETKILNNNENNQTKEIKKEEVAFQDQEPKVDLEIPQPESIMEVPMPPIPEVPNVVETSNTIPPIFEAKEETATDEVPMPPKTDFDFDALAASISKELESIGVSTDESDFETAPIVEPVIQEEKVEEPTINQGPRLEPIIEPEPVLNPVIFEAPAEVEPITEIKVEDIPPVQKIEENKPISTKAPFSSVFVNKKSEEPKIEEQNFVEPVEVTPTKPTIELPKTIDLPKLNTSSESKDENIPKMNFGSLENDIPSYPKNEENRM